MTESLDENTTYEDVFNSFMSTLYMHILDNTLILWNLIKQNLIMILVINLLIKMILKR